MKRNEIQRCCLCVKGVMHSKQITFSRVTIERFVIDLPAVQRLDGLENVFGGGGAGAMLASVMGTDEPIAKELSKDVRFVCDSCGSMRPTVVLELAETQEQPT